MTRPRPLLRLALILSLPSLPWTARAAEPQVVNLWPGKPPGETRELPPEQNIWKADDKPVGGWPIIKLTSWCMPGMTASRHATACCWLPS
jgi:hypothetical protein